MLSFKLSKSIKRIVIPQRAATTGLSTTGLVTAGLTTGLTTGLTSGAYVLKSKKRKKRKTSRSNRLLEKLIRRGARVQKKSANEYLYRHNRSSRKKKNGWLRDLSYNLSRSSRKGRKSFKLSNLF